MMQQFYPQVEHDYEFELNKDMHFAAAHSVDHPSAGICQNRHGHTYFANITIGGDELDEAGFLVNFKDIKKKVHGRYDHMLLNDFPEFTYQEPTTETLARQIFKNLEYELEKMPNKPKVLQVVLRETPTSYVVYRGGK